MSRHIGTFKGKKEIIKSVSTGIVGYVDQTLNLTVFYGGVDRGVSLSLSIGMDSHIQLDEKTANKLSELLSNWRKAPEID